MSPVSPPETNIYPPHPPDRHETTKTLVITLNPPTYIWVSLKLGGVWSVFRKWKLDCRKYPQLCQVYFFGKLEENEALKCKERAQEGPKGSKSGVLMARLTKLVEHENLNFRVVGSCPTLGAICCTCPTTSCRRASGSAHAPFLY